MSSEHSRLSLFAPTPPRVIATFLLATVCFCLPQDAPIEWLPLDDPDDGLLYLELQAASEHEGNLLIFPQTPSGFPRHYAIQVPLATVPRSITYTFPLPDVPITGFRFHLLGGLTEVRVESLRVISRRHEERYRFLPEHFSPLQQLDVTIDAKNRTRLTRTVDATDPRAWAAASEPLLGSGATKRNIKRAARSVVYLGALFALGTFAVFWTIEGHSLGLMASRRTLLFLGVVAFLFALVANRGLIRETFQTAFFAPADAIAASSPP